MSEPIIVRGAPALYYCETGILSKLDTLLEPYGFKRVLVVHGEHSWQAAQPFFPQQTRLTLLQLRYNGECTEAEAQRVADYAHAEQADVILGVGGGKVLDLVKAAGHVAQLETILAPTLASNCAAWTPLSVFYNEDGQFTTYTIFPKSSLMVLVEPTISLHAPIPYLRAGIADTLAKWYEADVLIRKVNNPSLAIQIAHHAAHLCRSILLMHGEASIQAAESKQLSDAFIQVIETIIMAGGMVGGYGDYMGRIAGAHAVHNGLTVAPATHDRLHGEKVAYGILIQLVLERNEQEVWDLLPFYKKMKLPYHLAGLGLSLEDHETLVQIAVGTTQPQESIHLMDVKKDGSSINADDVYQAIFKLEGLVYEAEDRISASVMI
ncbi:iron-containing alcohol dehydrogenase family protein [Paenibacillus sp. 481]|uniref:iron-containing alcohol dehydrogenase family protein n=1 Tax=Paenibacillus sp. 481 TaxID=2835869 RepID=UPI001E318CC7|nr:iron-containing alcohol dehydrogenase family protein [Paenibacillus sp. 481]UHA72225.1 iron-containing alcohol dehydrogenase family protein [Paenibacillus sp. 481]